MDYEMECGEQQAEAAADVNWCPPPMPMNYGPGLGATTAMTKEEYEKRQREARCQQAIYVLNAARDIRSNDTLMAEVRQYVRDERDRLGVFLDDIGK